MSRADLVPYRLWQLGVPLVAAFIGVIAGVSPVLGVAAAISLVYVALVMQNLALGLALFVGITFLENISGVGDLSAAKAAGGLLFLGWIARVATDDGKDRQLLRDHPVASAGIVALGTWALTSALWAELPDVAFSGAQRWILNLAMFPIVYTAVREPRHVRWVFALFVVGALISGGYGLFTGDITSDDVRLEGTGVNANELGMLLVVAMILAVALGACRELSASARTVAFGSAGLAILGVLTTASRGAVVGMVTALLVTPFVAGKGRRLLAVMLVVLAAGTTVTFMVGVVPSAAAERLTESDTSGTGRTDIWRVGWRMVQDKPIAGVGADNYANSTIHYLLEPGALTRSEFIVDRPKAAHNIYLQVLAELGVIGLTLFLAILAFVLLSVLKAARTFARLGERSMELMSRALVIGLCGQLAALGFSTAVYSKQLYLLLATGIAIAAIAREWSLRTPTPQR